MTIGENLKNIRLSRGLTQEDVAKAAKVSIQTIFKYEQGIITNIPLDKIQVMAELFDVDPASLIGWKRSEEIARPNGDLSSLREQLRRQPGMRILFDAGKNSTEEDLIEAARMLERFKKLRDGDES